MAAREKSLRLRRKLFILLDTVGIIPAKQTNLTVELLTFARASLGVPPVGWVPGLPDQRPVPLSKRGSLSGKNKIRSVLSVPLW